MEKAGRKLVAEEPAFFERYFALCEKYAKRIELQERMRKDRGRDDETAKVKEQLAELACELQQAEEMVWSEPADGQAQRFAEYAGRFGLERFAQRATLLLLYRELARGEESELPPIQLIEALDFSGAMTVRMKLLRQFAPEGALLRNKVLRVERDRFRHRGGLTLSPQHMELLSRLADDETVKWSDYGVGAESGKESGEENDEEMPERVGRVCAPSVTLDDVVLEPKMRARLELFLNQHRDGTLEKLGVTKKIRYSKGLTLLFYGPPGTGKSMLAEAAAAQLGREVLHVEVPKIMSRWVGETDKQIARAFAAAKVRNLVLLFDEADSLLTRREMLYQDHDIRFVNDMLSAIEHYEGTVILTTNMDTLLDPAVERRIDLRVKFEPPTAAQREIIWQKHIRMEVPLADDIDCAQLAREYEFTGGYVRNAALTGVRKMAADKRDMLTMADLLFGAEMERDGLFVTDHRRKRITGFTGTSKTCPPAQLAASATAFRNKHEVGA